MKRLFKNKLKEIITILRFSLGRGNNFSRGVRIQFNSKVTRTSIGGYSYIGDYCVIDKATIGNYVSIAAGVQIGGMEHAYSDWAMNTHVNSNWVKQETIIGNDVWVGSKSTLRQGIKVGNGAVIGAGSVVLNDVPAYSIVVGVPARLLKYRFSEVQIDALEKSEWYNLKPKEAKTRLGDL